MRISTLVKFRDEIAYEPKLKMLAEKFENDVLDCLSKSWVETISDVSDEMRAKGWSVPGTADMTIALEERGFTCVHDGRKTTVTL